MNRSLSAFDAQFVAGETGNLMAHYCALWFALPDASGAPLTRQRVRDLVASRIDRVPALRWRLKTVPLNLDHPSFVDGPVDLDQHVHGRTLAAGAGRREVAAAVSEIMAVRLDRSRPLWEFHVLDGLDDGRVAVVMKFHHASADALSAEMLMTLLLDTEPSGRDDLPDPVAPVEPPRTRDVTWDALESLAGQPMRAAKAAANAIPHLDQVPMMRTLPGASTVARAARRVSGVEQPEPLAAPRTRFNGALTARRSIAFGSVPVADVRALKDAHGATFNDVVVAAVAGGLRRRLSALDELPADPLVAFVPANVRTGETDGRIQNAISSFVVAIPTHADDAADRVALARRGMDAAKARHANAPVTLLEDANAMVFPVAFGPLAAGMLKLMGTGLVSPPLNLTLSNVPGPPQPLHLDGAPLQAVAPLSLIFEGVTLNVTVVSYAGRLEIGVVADHEALPDAFELTADIEAEFAAMSAALVRA